jgi:hypothetical protein
MPLAWLGTFTPPILAHSEMSCIPYSKNFGCGEHKIQSVRTCFVDCIEEVSLSGIENKYITYSHNVLQQLRKLIMQKIFDKFSGNVLDPVDNACTIHCGVHASCCLFTQR